MKTRHGFVSNSSSSSFLIYGICGDEFELTSEGKSLILEKYNSVYMKEENETDEDYLDRVFEDIMNDDGWYEIMDTLDSGIEVEHPSYDDDYYLGLSWNKVKDDETGLQFKNRVKELIKKYIVIDDDKFGTFAEAWHDG